MKKGVKIKTWKEIQKKYKKKKDIEAFQTKVLVKQVHIIAEDVAGEKRLNCLKKKKKKILEKGNREHYNNSVISSTGHKIKNIRKSEVSLSWSMQSHQNNLVLQLLILQVNANGLNKINKNFGDKMKGQK